MYSYCSFWYVLVSFYWAFLSFCVLAFIRFLYWVKMLFLKKKSSHFSLTTSDSHRLSTFGSCFGCYALYYCFYVSINKVFIFIVQTMSFRYFLKSIKFFFFTVTIYLLLISLLEVKNCHNVWFWLLLSYFCVHSGISLLR